MVTRVRVTFWCGSVSPDPYLWLLDPDPTPFSIDFKDAKQNVVSYFFLITCPKADHVQTKKFNFLLKFCVYGSAPLNNGSESGRPKNMRILRIRIPNTAIKVINLGDHASLSPSKTEQTNAPKSRQKWEEGLLNVYYLCTDKNTKL